MSDETDPTRVALESMSVELRSFAGWLDGLADSAPPSPRLFLLRAVAAITDARAFVGNALSYIENPETTP